MEPRPIPPLLFSVYEDRPFTICTRCGESLVHFDRGYLVSKVFKAGECLVEYAICHPCHERMISEYSNESKRALQAHHERHYHDLNSLEVCVFCQQPSRRDGEYSVGGMCLGQQLHHAMHVCHPCAEKIQGLISASTRDVWRRFREENMPGPPADLLPTPEPLLQP